MLPRKKSPNPPLLRTLLYVASSYLLPLSNLSLVKKKWEEEEEGGGGESCQGEVLFWHSGKPKQASIDKQPAGEIRDENAKNGPSLVSHKPAQHLTKYKNYTEKNIYFKFRRGFQGGRSFKR